MTFGITWISGFHFAPLFLCQGTCPFHSVMHIFSMSIGTSTHESWRMSCHIWDPLRADKGIRSSKYPYHHESSLRVLLPHVWKQMSWCIRSHLSRDKPIWPCHTPSSHVNLHSLSSKMSCRSQVLLRAGKENLVSFAHRHGYSSHGL